MISTNEILKSTIFNYKVIPLDDNIINALTGEGGKKVFIAFSDGQTKDLTDFLEKIFNSVNINLLKDTQLIHFSKNTLRWLNPFFRENEIMKVFFFGVEPKNAGLNLEHIKYIPVELDGITYLFADEIGTIMNDQALKKHLWRALKEIFPDSAVQ